MKPFIFNLPIILAISFSTISCGSAVGALGGIYFAPDRMEGSVFRKITTESGLDSSVFKNSDADKEATAAAKYEDGVNFLVLADKSVPGIDEPEVLKNIWSSRRVNFRIIMGTEKSERVKPENRKFIEAAVRFAKLFNRTMLDRCGFCK